MQFNATQFVPSTVASNEMVVAVMVPVIWMPTTPTLGNPDTVAASFAAATVVVLLSKFPTDIAIS
jgi:hypothetical protein